MEDSTILWGMAAAPIIVGLVAAIGGALKFIPRDAYPLLAIVLGVGWNAALAIENDNLGVTPVLYGVVVGLSASGLWSSAVKPVVAEVKKL